METSIGLDRMFLAVLSYSYCEEELDNGENRIVLKIPHILGSYKGRYSTSNQKRRNARKGKRNHIVSSKGFQLSV